MTKIKFNFILPKPIKQKQRNNATSIIQKVDGMVEEDSSTGVCRIRLNDGRLFDIHPDCYNTKGWRRIYAKTSKGEWFCYDRPILDDRIKMPAAYVPFKPEFATKGAIVSYNGNLVYKITKCYNPNDERQCMEAEVNDRDK